MQLQPPPAYFLIKVNSTDQHTLRQKSGKWFNHPDHTFMQFEQQWGEIVSIGSIAHKVLPEANIGDTLIFHHFITGNESTDEGETNFYLMDEGGYRFYIVPATYIFSTGDKNLVYGVWNGSEIIPHKDYIFLEPEIELSDTASVSETGLLTLDGWKESREAIGDKLKYMKRQVAELTKSNITDELTQGIEQKEREMNAISKRINQKEYCTFDVAHINHETKKQFLNEFTKVGMLNMGCHTKVFFQDKEYIVAQTTYLSFSKLI